VLDIEESQEQTTAKIVAAAAEAAAKAVSEAAVAAAQVASNENHTALTAIAVLQTEVSTLKNQQTCFEAEFSRKMNDMSVTFDKIFAKLDDALLGRPSWAVALILGALFSMCVGLIVFTATNVK